MDIDMEYEVYKYLNRQAESYVPLNTLLCQRNLTFEAAEQLVQDFREKAFRLMKQYQIGNANLVQICRVLAARIKDDPQNADLVYLYFCIMTDLGLINEINSADCTAEQAVRNYFRQQDAVSELLDFYQEQLRCRDILYQIRTVPKHSYTSNNTDDKEMQLLTELLREHDFLRFSDILTDNLLSLMQAVSGNEKVRCLKPYILFAVLTRKHGMMQNRAHYLPNLQSVFQYQSYQIDCDNGKNFNSYQDYVELYDSLRRYYESDDSVDMQLSDFCFANLSPLSEWYYRFCEPDFAIPMTLRRKVQNAESVSFPMLFCYDTYSDADIGEFEHQHADIYRQWKHIMTPAMTEQCLQLLCQNRPLHECTALLPKSEQYPLEAELFLFEFAEPTLEAQMLEIADLLIKIE